MKIYLIAAGGSGAKIAEALIHVCGAGLGPDFLHILSVDTDDDNGNLSRLTSTHAAYEGCRKFKWSRNGQRVENSSLFFATQVKFDKLSANTPVSDWGLVDSRICPQGYGDVLDLFFTEDEQNEKCKEGFLARPNLGSLVMGKHLSDQLGNTPFLRCLRDDLEAADQIRLVVAGSVFGGTGASVLPIAPDSILQALLVGQGQAAVTAIQNSWQNIPKSAVMLKPYFFPSGAPNQQAETVDPSRFYADTKNALEHYHSSGASNAYSNIHVIGADDTAQMRLAFCEGSRNQRNAPSIVELVASLACLEPPAPNQPIRFLNPAENAERLKLDNLPWPGGETGALDFSLFLHAATFIVRNQKFPMSRGILQLLKDRNAMEEIPIWPWASEFLTDHTGKIQKFNPSTGARELSTYFLRLLLWAYRVSESRGDLSIIEWRNTPDALPYWDALCAASKGNDIPDVKEDGTVANPHPIAVTMAAACVSAFRTLRKEGRNKGPKLLVETIKTICNSTNPTESLCSLPFVYDDFAAAEASEELKLSAEYENITRS